MKKKLFENVGGNNFKLSEMRDIYGISHAYDDISRTDDFHADFRDGPPRPLSVKPRSAERLASDEIEKEKHDKDKKMHERQRVRIKKKKELLDKFLNKNRDQILKLYAKYASKEIKNDPDVKSFFIRGGYTPEISNMWWGNFEQTEEDLHKFARGMTKVVALKSQSAAEKIKKFFGNLFKD